MKADFLLYCSSGQHSQSIHYHSIIDPNPRNLGAPIARMGNAETKEAVEIITGVEPISSGAENRITTDKVVVLEKDSVHLQDVLIDDIPNERRMQDSSHNNRSKSATKEEFVVHQTGSSGKNTSHEIEQKSVASKNQFSHNKQRFNTLLEDEIAVRRRIQSMPGAQGQGGLFNVITSSVINMISALLVFIFYLISLESLLSIGLSVGLTICK